MKIRDGFVSNSSSSSFSLSEEDMAREKRLERKKKIERVMKDFDDLEEELKDDKLDKNNKK